MKTIVFGIGAALLCLALTGDAEAQSGGKRGISVRTKRTSTTTWRGDRRLSRTTVRSSRTGTRTTKTNFAASGRRTSATVRIQPRRGPPRTFKVKFDRKDHPDFQPHAFRLPTGRRSVTIEATGNRRTDARRADRAAGFGKDQRPRNHHWHHHRDGKTMILVPSALHSAVHHQGGVKKLKGKK
jgi:hypothetical protein